MQDIRYYASNQLFICILLSLVIGGFSSFFVINGGSQEVYLTLFGMAIVSMMLIVPAQVLYSSSSRWSHDKVEMLRLTALSPLQVVLGRFGAAMILNFILCATLLPFMAITFLVPGGSITSLLLTWVLVLTASAIAVACTIGVSWLTRIQWLQNLIRLGWTLILLQVVAPLTVVPYQLMQALNQNELDPRLIRLCFGVGGAVFTQPVLFGAADRTFATSRREPVHSLRTTLLLFWCFCFLTLVAFVINELSTTSFVGLTANYLIEPAVFALISCGVCSLFFVLENRRVGRRVLIDLPSNRLRRILFIPLLPGPGAAVLFFFLLSLPIVISGELTLLFVGLPKGSLITTFAWLFAFIAFGPVWFHRIKGLKTLLRRRVLLGLWSFLVVLFFGMLNGFAEVYGRDSIRDCKKQKAIDSWHDCSGLEEQHELFQLLVNPVEGYEEMVSVSSVKGLLLTQSVVLIVLSLLLCWPSIFDALRRLLAKEPLLHSDYDLAPPDDAKERLSDQMQHQGEA